jgi:hypothetical protein
LQAGLFTMHSPFWAAEGILAGSAHKINSGETTMDRNSQAALSPQELSALWQLRVDPGHPLSPVHG